MMIVALPEAGMALRSFLSQKLNLPGREIKRTLERNSCRVNGIIERFGSRRLAAGDSIEYLVREASREPVTILFEDERCIIYNKPAGMRSEELGPHLCHRLDRGTSGALLVAKSDPKPFEDLFRKREIEKVYLAIVDGVPSESEGVIRNTLGQIGAFEGQKIWGELEGGKLAITHWRVKRILDGAALIECRPTTGRTHQLRVHLASLGHPVIGDGQYGRRATRMAARPMLHAQMLMGVEAPLPKDFLEQL